MTIQSATDYLTVFASQGTSNLVLTLRAWDCVGIEPHSIGLAGTYLVQSEPHSNPLTPAQEPVKKSPGKPRRFRTAARTKQNWTVNLVLFHHRFANGNPALFAPIIRSVVPVSLAWKQTAHAIDPVGVTAA